MGIKHFLPRFKLKPSLLGIDITPNFVRIVELSCSDNEYQVESCLNVRLTKDRYEDHLKAALKQLVTKTRSIALALSHDEVVFKRFEIASNLSPKELDNFLRFRLQDDFATTNEISIDYQTTLQGKMMLVQLVAAQKALVETKKLILQSVSFVPKIIDVDVYAIKRAICLQLKDFARLVAVINVDYDSIFIVVLRGKDVVCMHKELVGEETLVELLNAKLAMVCSGLSQPLDRIMLGGEMACLSGMVESLHRCFQLPIAIVNPFLGMKRSKKITSEQLDRLSPLMLVSCGLAMRVSGSGN